MSARIREWLRPLLLLPLLLPLLPLLLLLLLLLLPLPLLGGRPEEESSSSLPSLPTIVPSCGCSVVNA